ncbi:MAG: ABC transporter ATP-binding protein [Pseudomonadota bacterium]
MAEPVLQTVRLRKAFGALTVTDGVSLTLMPGECHALIGPNGAGKTTLINLITGLVAPDEGEIRLAGRPITGLPTHARARLGLARCFQITSLIPGFSVLENVALAVQARSGSSYRFFRPAAREERLNAPGREALTATGLVDRAADKAGALSHGEQRALELAVALASDPKALILDEPMAGTGHGESAALTALLQGVKARIPILLVEHDMDAVFALADRVSVLDAGRIIATGTPDQVRADPAARSAYLGTETA